MRPTSAAAAALAAFLTFAAPALAQEGPEARPELTLELESLTNATVHIRFEFGGEWAAEARRQLDRDEDGRVSEQEAQKAEREFQDDFGSDVFEAVRLDGREWTAAGEAEVVITGLVGPVDSPDPVVASARSAGEIVGEPAPGANHTLTVQTFGAGTIRVPAGHEVDRVTGGERVDACTVTATPSDEGMTVVQFSAREDGGCGSSVGGRAGVPAPAALAAVGALAAACLARRRRVA